MDPVTNGLLILVGGLTPVVWIIYYFWRARRKLPTLAPLFYHAARADMTMVGLVEEQWNKIHKKQNGEEVKLPELWVIAGHDGNEWLRVLLKWAGQGVKIHLLVIAPSREEGEKLSDLSSHSPEWLEIRVINDPNKVVDPRAKELSLKYMTYHYALFENPSMMWVEGTHRSSPAAFHCQFVPPQYIDRERRFEDYKPNFMIVWEQAMKV